MPPLSTTLCRSPRRSQAPVAFTEIAWPTVPGDAQGEEHQAEFLRWFLQETKMMNLELVIWPFLHDLAPPEKKERTERAISL